MEEARVVINVGGKTFTTLSRTLANVPNTRLAELSTSSESFDSDTGEHFFDRNPLIFGPILDFYRSGELHFAHCICGPSIQRELEFWSIDENCISPCCWKAYKEAEAEAQTMQRLAKTLLAPGPTVNKSCCPELEEADYRKSWWFMLKKRMWSILEYPYCCWASKVWACVLFILIVTSILVVTLETHPTFRVSRDTAFISNENDTNSKHKMFFQTDLHPVLTHMDTVCTFVFFLELTLRFVSSPSRTEFFKSGFNIIDIFCILPMLIVKIIEWSDPNIWSESEFYLMISYLSLASVLRVFRLFKLARHFRGLKILQLAVRSSLKELFLLIIMIMIGMLIFSTLMYYAEFNEDNEFTSIPVSFWWSIITMTTVGYGDMTPKSSWGYLVGCISAIAGTLIMGLPIPIIASNFNHYYNYSQVLVKMAQRKTPLISTWKGKIPQIRYTMCNYTYGSTLNLRSIENDNISLASTSGLNDGIETIPLSSVPSIERCPEGFSGKNSNNNCKTKIPGINIDCYDDNTKLEVPSYRRGSGMDSALGISFQENSSPRARMVPSSLSRSLSDTPRSTTKMHTSHV